MSIKDQLTADMKQAMKDREAGKLRLSVIRMVRAAKWKDAADATHRR